MSSRTDPVRLALFDFDNTVAAGDSIVSFLLYAVRHGAVSHARLLSAVFGYLRVRLQHLPANVCKESVLRFLTAFSAEERKAFCQDYIRTCLMPKIYPAASAEMEKCRAEGFRVVIVSASVSLYMQELLSFLPVDSILSTPALLDGDGRYTGNLGENCRGPEKVVRIRRWLAEKQLSADWKNCRGYGDSDSDHFMLDLTPHRILINPSGSLLRRYPGAEIRHWKINRKGGSNQ